MDVQDGQVVVYRESARDSKQLLSNLKETVGFIACSCIENMR